MMMMHLLSGATSLVRAGALAGGLALAAGQALAQDYTWDLANEYPAGSVHGRTADAFIAALDRISGGKIKIVPHHGGALGYKSIDQYDAVGQGAVDIAFSFATPWSGLNPLYTLSSIPFLAQTAEDEFKLYEIARPYYEAAMEQDDMVLILATPWPPSGLWGNKPLNSLDAIKGVHVRSYDANGTITLGNAGATPIQLSWADTIPQLTTNGISAVLTSADGGSASMLWEHQSHFTEVNYAMPLQIMHMNLPLYEGLSDEEKGWIAEAAKEAEAFGWSLLASNVSENYALMQSHGMTIVTDLEPGFAEALATAAAPTVADWKTKVGADADAILSAYEAAKSN